MKTPIKFTKENIKKILLQRRTIVNKCWLYNRKLHRTGYAYIELGHKPYAIHRLSLWIFKDFDLNSGFDSLHITDCPNKHCFNPEHLYSGTQKDNVADSIELGNHVIFGKV